MIQSYTTLGALLLAFALQAAGFQDPLTAGKIDEKQWQIGKMGSITPTPEGVHLVGGEGENAATLASKRKFSPDEPYDFTMELKPLAAENQGYAVLIGAPGWFVANRGDGGFWLQTDATVVATTEALPMDRWYKIAAKNRRGAIQVTLTDDEAKVLGNWTAPKGAGLEGSLYATALTGTARPGPRGMVVRNMKVEPIDESACEFLPEEEQKWLRAAYWRVAGEGTVTNLPDGSLRANLEPGAALILRFPKRIPRQELVETNVDLTLRSADESYNLTYLLRGEGEGYLYLNDLNRSGNLNGLEVIINTELAPVFGKIPENDLQEFQISATFMDTPFQVTITRFQLTIQPR